MAWRSWLGIGAVVLVGCTDDRVPLDDSTTGPSPTDTGATTSPTDDGADAASDDAEPVPTGGSPQVCEGEGSWSGPVETGAGGGSTSGGGPVGMDDDMPLAASIPEIQLGELALGTFVLVEGAVVTTTRVERAAEPGTELFVQDPAGGPWSGLRVQVPQTATIDPVEIGDTVDVVGRVVSRGEFFAVQLSSVDPQLVATGTAPLPEPALVPVEWLDVEGADGRAYESVPVRVEQVVVTDDACDGELVLEDLVRVDDRFIPGQLPSPAAGTVLSVVEGVLIYSEDSLEIGPRDPGSVS